MGGRAGDRGAAVPSAGSSPAGSGSSLRIRGDQLAEKVVLRPVGQAAHADADEAKAATHVDVSEQLPCDADHDPRVVGRCRQGRRASQGREVVQPDLHRDRATRKPRGSKPFDDPASHAVDHRRKLGDVGDVVFEGVLDAHRLRFALRRHLPIVEPVREQPQAATLTVAQGTNRVGFGQLGKIGDAGDSDRSQLGGRCRARLLAAG